MLPDELGKQASLSGAAMFTDLNSFSIKAWRAGYSSTDELGRPLYDMQRWDRLRTSDKLHDLVRSNPRLSWIDRHGFFCDREGRVCKLFDENGNPLIWDNAHLTVTVYDGFAIYVEETLRSARAADRSGE